MSIAASRAWPRRRLQIRSVLSATMSIGWLWVASTALIPYFLIGRGRGAGSLEMFGIARTTWLSFHVWSSIVVGLLTIGHVLLNRRGLVRSYRVTSGVALGEASSRPAGRRRRGFTWVAAMAVLVVAVGGSWAFASVDGGRVGNGSVNTQEEESEAGAQQTLSGNRHRGGRSDSSR